MRYGIVSDIHSNLEALEVALDNLSDTDDLICVGDLIGYGPNPNECCDLIRERSSVIVIGNHDAAAVGRVSLDWFNPYARAAAEWTAEQISDENREFLRSLPLIHRDDDFVVVHGSLDMPEDFEYIASPLLAMPCFAEMHPHRLCLIGHTHVAEYYAQRDGEIGSDRISMVAGGTFELNPAFRYIVNCGSVGQPRDYDPRIAVGLYDTEAGSITVLRLEYPVEVTQQKMRDADLPTNLWQRLEFGL